MKDPAYQSLMDYALRALSMRAHTVHELHQKLLKRDETATHTEAVLSRLLELKLLDDEAYLERAIEQAQNKAHGPRKLAQKLFQKGISTQVTQQAWNKTVTSERDIALRALQSLQLKIHHLPPQKQYERRARFLANRGFPAEIVFDLAKTQDQA